MHSFTSRLSDPTKIISPLWKHNFKLFSSIATIKFDDETKNRFTNLVKNKSSDPYQDYLLVQNQSSEILRKLISQDIQKEFEDFGKKGRSLILLQNCPFVGSQGLPETPKSFTKSADKDYVSEYFMLGMAGLMNAKPYIIENVRDSSVINQIIPLDPKSISGSGSKLPFNLHNEVVHEPITPDFFLLFCLRGSPLAKTNYCLLEDIIKFLPKQTLEELQKPNFIMQSGDKSVFKEAKEFRCPIISKDELGDFEIRLNTAPNRCTGTTIEAKNALNYIFGCLKNNVAIHEIILSQGDTLLIDNKKSLHGRTAFDENYKVDPKDDTRWIQRMNLKKDSHKSRSLC
jgi:L-asparagine oxygenase